MPKPKSLAVLLRKRYKLAYSRVTHDKRIYGLYIFNPHFLDIIAARCTRDIEEAKKRVTFTAEGRYRYQPSEEYLQFKISLLKKQYKTLKTNEHGHRT